MEINLYVDGSYAKSKPNETAGAAVVVYNDTVVMAQRYITSKYEYTKMNNVGGELMAASYGMSLVMAFMQQLNINSKFTLNVYYDYKGIYEFVKKVGVPWQPKSPGSIQYVSIVRALEKNFPQMTINFIKVKSHTGNKWNEVVDKLAGGNIPIDCKNNLLETVIV